MSENTLLGDIAPAQTPDSSTPPSTPPVTPPPVDSLPDWLKGVDPEIAKDPSLKVFTNPQDLIKSYVHAQKMMGREKVILPTKNSTDTEWKQFYHKMGLPAELDAYQLNKGEKYVVNDDVLSEFKKLAHESNLLPAQAQKVMDWFNEKAYSNMEAGNTQKEQQITQGWEELGKEWGQGFDKNMSAAKAVIQEFADQSFIDYLNQTGLGDDPKLARFLANIGSNLREDSFQEGTAAHLGMTPAEAKSEYARIIADPNSAYRNEMHPDHKAEVERVNKLFQVM